GPRRGGVVPVVQRRVRHGRVRLHDERELGRQRHHRVHLPGDGPRPGTASRGGRGATPEASALRGRGGRGGGGVSGRGLLHRDAGAGRIVGGRGAPQAVQEAAPGGRACLTGPCPFGPPPSPTWCRAASCRLPPPATMPLVPGGRSTPPWPGR